MNEAQLEVLRVLGAKPDERPEFPLGLRDHLRDLLEEELTPVAAALGTERPLAVSKHVLAQALGCERRFLATDDAPFVVTPQIARGAVAHKAVELSIHWPVEPEPLNLVDEAIARLTESDAWLADWLRTCSDADRAELRAEANDRVVKFLECWPRLQPQWWPATEQSLLAELSGGRIRLRGKTDLALGRAEGHRAGKVIVDFKTGGWNPAHLQDLRFYALVETLRIGTPPRMVASAYLDAGTLHTEAVTVDLLESAAARVIDGVERIVALRAGDRPPTTAPSTACRWCPVLADCDAGRLFLADDPDARTDDDDTDADDL